MKNEKVIDTVKKILSKTVDNGASPEEAANASALAQKLLTKYRLSMADVDGYSPGAIGTYQSSIKGKRLPTWKVYLASTIADVNGCRVIQSKNKASTSISFIGSIDDVTIVKEMFDHLSERINTLTRSSCVGRGKTYANSFRMGMFSAISKRLKQAVKDARTEAAESALVKIDNRSDEVEKWIKNNLKLTKPRAAAKINYNNVAVHAGMDAGNTVKLNPAKKIGKE